MKKINDPTVLMIIGAISFIVGFISYNLFNQSLINTQLLLIPFYFSLIRLILIFLFKK